MISTVAVRPAYRRRGLARALLDTAHTALRAHRRRYAVLEVLEENAPALALYRSLGYRRLRGGAVLVRELAPAASAAPGASAAGGPIRAFLRRDARALVPVAAAGDPPEVSALLPVTPGQFSIPPLIAAIVGSTSEAWVIDGPSGPRGFLRATAGSAGQPGHLTQPILAADVAPGEAGALLQRGLDFLTSHGANRAVLELPDGRPLAARTLTTAGFVEAYRTELEALDLGAR
jgi:hypothetical protein